MGKSGSGAEVQVHSSEVYEFKYKQPVHTAMMYINIIFLTPVFLVHQSLKMLSNPLADPNEIRQVASTGPCPQSALYQDLLVMAYRGTAKAGLGDEDQMMCSVQEPQTSNFVFLETDKQLKPTSSELNGDLGSDTNFKDGTDEGRGCKY